MMPVQGRTVRHVIRPHTPDQQPPQRRGGIRRIGLCMKKHDRAPGSVSGDRLARQRGPFGIGFAAITTASFVGSSFRALADLPDITSSRSMRMGISAESRDGEQTSSRRGSTPHRGRHDASITQG